MKRQSIAPKVEKFTCGLCKLDISDVGEIVFIQSTGCFHQVHRHCFKSACFERQMKSRGMHCPDCDKEVQQFEIREYLSPEDI